MNVNTNINEIPMIISTLLAVTLVLMVITNIIIQTIKASTYDKIPTNILVIIVSMILTPLSIVAVCQFTDVKLEWYIVGASFILAFFVAYAAMFGYDKLVETLIQLKRIGKKTEVAEIEDDSEKE